MDKRQTILGLPSRSGFLPDRTVHLHPLRRCNLACKHCYSKSSPQATDILSMEILRPALTQLRRQGYEVLSLSGGEPMLYPELEALIKHAKALGFRVVAISNGFRVSPQFSHLLQQFDGLAISFDGTKNVHNRVRGNPRAYDAAISALEYLSSSSIPAAAAYTVSKESLGDIPEFVEMAAQLNISAVQLRPLVMAGRAANEYSDPALSPIDMKRLWMIGQALAAAYQGRPSVHTDLAPAQAIAADRGAWSAVLEGKAKKLSDLVNPLVITPEGWLRPFTYDFPNSFILGHIDDIANSKIAPSMSAAPKLRMLLGAIFDDIEHSDEFVDWFAYCRDFAREGEIAA